MERDENWFFPLSMVLWFFDLRWWVARTNSLLSAPWTTGAWPIVQHNQLPLRSICSFPYSLSSFSQSSGNTRRRLLLDKWILNNVTIIFECIGIDSRGEMAEVKLHVAFVVINLKKFLTCIGVNDQSGVMRIMFDSSSTFCWIRLKTGLFYRIFFNSDWSALVHAHIVHNHGAGCKTRIDTSLNGDV